MNLNNVYIKIEFKFEFYFYYSFLETFGGHILKKTTKKLLFYVAGLFLLAIGVNISKVAQLGISPVSAIPYAMELIWSIKLGNATLIFNILLISAQVALLRKNYNPVQLLQIVCTYLFGIFINYTSRDYLLAWLPLPSSYIIKLLYLFVSILIIGIGVSFYLIPNLVPLPAEGLVNSIVKKSNDKLKFANTKVAVDSCMVFASAILSVIFLGGLKSVREGTVLAALLIGKVVGIIFKRYKQVIIEWIEK